MPDTKGQLSYDSTSVRYSLNIETEGRVEVGVGLGTGSYCLVATRLLLGTMRGFWG